MHVLLTGAFGNLGQHTLQRLLDGGHTVTAFDLPTPANRKAARRWNDPRITVHWGDITCAADRNAALADSEAVIHLAAMLPPATERWPDKAEAVNVMATRALIERFQARHPDGRFLYASSVTVFGDRQHQPAPRRVDDPIEPSDVYTRHKVTCEQALRESSLAWVVLRVGVSVALQHSNAGLDTLRMMFAVHPDNRFEYVHPDDAARAFVTALEHPDAARRVFLLGGGADCQKRQRDLINGLLGAAGLTFPDHALGTASYYTDWMDTDESQALLNFQHHSWDDLVAEARAALRWVRWLTWLPRPLVRRAAIRLLSPPPGQRYAD